MLVNITRPEQVLKLLKFMKKKKKDKNKNIVSHIKPYLNTDLTNMPGEIWKSVVGYDGIYSVSNYGRVKSETRYNSRGQIVRERILKQAKTRGGLKVVLYDNGKGQNFMVLRLMGNAFLGEKNKNEVYCYNNKNNMDNRLENIVKTTRSESSKIDFIKGKKIKTILADVVIEKALEELEELGTFENGKLISKKCPSCFNVRTVLDYYINRNGTYRRICKYCFNQKKLKRSENYEKEKLNQQNKKVLADKGIRQCNVCKEHKNLHTDFFNDKGDKYGKSRTCKRCRKIYYEQNKQKYNSINYKKKNNEKN